MHSTLIQRELHTRQSFRRANDQLSTRPSIVVHVQEGPIQAYGEACPLAQFAGERYDACLSALQKALLQIRVQEIPLSDWHLVISSDFPCARFALDTARIDFQAQQTKQSFAQVLNPLAAKRIQIQGLLNAEESVSQAFPVLKCKVGHLAIPDEIQRLQLIQAQLPADALLRLDANGAWTRSQALDFCSRIQSFDLRIDYLEDPCAHLSDNQFIAEQCSLPIALDHSIAKPDERAAALNSKQIAAFIVKPMCLGHIADCISIAQPLLDSGKRVVISDFLNGSIARSAARHIAAALDTQQREWHGLSGDALFTNDFHQLQQDCIFMHSLDSKPGLGLGNIESS